MTSADVTVTPATAVTEAVTIYAAIGGRPALTAAVDGFYARVLSDPVLSSFFPDGVGARHRGHLVTALGEALGGPERYQGPDLTAVHRGLGISDTHFARVLNCLDAALAFLGVPRDLTDRILGIVGGLRQVVVTAA